LLFVAFVSLLLGGCGASSPRGYSAAPAAPAGPAANDYVQVRAEAESISVDSAVTGGSAGPSRPGPASTDPRVDYDRKFVKTAWIDLEVGDEDEFEPTVSRVQEVAEGLGGYAVEISNDSITTKVPTERLDEALVAITSLAEVTHRNVRVSDVTSRYVDLQIRIANLEKVRDRLQELVEQGEDVKAILEVEKELNRVTADLERQKGQMRMLSNQVTFATIHVNVEESVTPGPIGWIFYGGYHAVKWLFVWD
jgi:hypothetical protein